MSTYIVFVPDCYMAIMLPRETVGVGMDRSARGMANCKHFEWSN